MVLVLILGAEEREKERERARGVNTIVHFCVNDPRGGR